jgi:UPF0755 protein
VRRLLVVVALVSLIFLAAYRELRWPVRGVDAPTQTLIVPQGASADSIGRQLRELGLVRHPFVFKALIQLRGAASQLRAGEYSLEGPLSLDQIVDMLRKGEVVRHDVTFPEGKSIEEMAVIVSGHGFDGAAFLKAARNPAAIKDLDPGATDLEGYLFPDTYDLSRTPEATASLVSHMVQRFRAVIAPELPQLAARGLTVRQVVTLASLVELETARSEERPRIAAVFLNRLQKGMLLQTDPTVIYALRKAGVYDGNIRKKDLDVDSPYNTYRRPGLPPGPIGSAGREALASVLHPAPGNELYFVSRNDGTHQFSATLTEHERAVDLYQRRLRRSGP